ncbi:hypothetical protein FOA52_000451 [Chlamydomonas sp. UWO 241]|nr:hypothetical protein FOA52_000451 [Chlamydomonas sp. UWO 241]
MAHGHMARVDIRINSLCTKHAWTVDGMAGDKYSFAEDTDFNLKKADIDEFRKTLFPQAAHAALSAKIGDYALMTWILGAAGYDDGRPEVVTAPANPSLPPGTATPKRRYLDLPDGTEVKHNHDGKVGVLLRRVCGAATAADATWEPFDWEANMEAAAEERRAARRMHRCVGYDDSDDGDDGWNSPSDSSDDY